MKVTKKLLEVLAANFLTLDEIAFIWQCYFKEDWEIALTPASMNKLIRLRMIDAKENILENGENILVEILDLPKKPEFNLDVKSKAFEAFWKLYPRDDAHNTYSKTRQLRWNKAETKKCFLEASEEYTPEQLTNALLREIQFRTSPSKENLMLYMCNSVNWFKKGAFEAFLTYEEDADLKDEYGKGIS